MTKAEVIAEISAKTGVEKLAAQECVETFFKVVRNSMVEGKNVYFRGFGSFIVKKRARKIARNFPGPFLHDKASKAPEVDVFTFNHRVANHFEEGFNALLRG